MASRERPVSPGASATVRFYEHTGRGGDVALTFDWVPSSAQIIDFLEQPVSGQAQVTGNRVTVGVKPWQIVTLKLGRQ